MNNRSRIDDFIAESLLTGDMPRDPELASLCALLDEMRMTVGSPIDSAHMATRLAATARASLDSDARRGLGRVASIGLAGVMVVSTAGIALAADSAAPGDLLYGLDQTLEAIGLGAGGLDERAAEFRDLIDSDESDAANELLTELVDEYGAATVSAALDRVVLEESAEVDNEDVFSPTAQPDGQSAASVAPSTETGPDVSSDTTPAETGPPETAGPPENAGPKQEGSTNPQGDEIGPPETAGPPENAGPKGDETGPPETAGPPENAGPKQEGSTNPQGDETGPPETAGPPENAGPKQETSTNPQGNETGAKDK